MWAVWRTTRRIHKFAAPLNFSDQRFAKPGYKYGIEPDAFLMEQAARLTAPADVLAPGDGEGRNGVWLARQGHRVTAVDYSPVGLQKARDLGRPTRGVAVATVLADLADWTPAPASFDAVVLVYTHLPGQSAAAPAGVWRQACAPAAS